MKKLLFYLFTLIFPALGFAQSPDFKLVNIKYYQNAGCSSENPILVKVCFNTNYTKISTLQMVVTSENSTTYTTQVKDFDIDGSIFYTFCSKIGETTNFEIYFRNQKGVKSDTFGISATPESFNIEKKEN